jgi:hypothetical protein
MILPISICKGCGATIHWIETENGKIMPVNTGVVTVILNESRRITLVTEKGETLYAAKPGDKGYVPHWSNCPKANKFRKKSGKVIE